MTEDDISIKVGTGFTPKSRNRYPFHLLTKKGQHFVWPILKDGHSLRVQASRQKRDTGIDFRVSVTPEGVVVYHNGRAKPKASKPKLKK